MNYIEKIQSVESTIQENTIELTKLSERLNVAKEERKQLLIKLKEQNISEQELEQKITELDNELSSEIEKIEKELE